MRRRVEKGKSIWEARIGDTTVSATGGPTRPPAELQRVLAALLRGQEVVQVARLRRGKNDVALLDGQRVLASYVGMDEALEHALGVPVQEVAPAKDAPDVEHLRAFLRTQLAEIERHDPAVRVGSDGERFPRTWLFHRRWGRAVGATTARGESIRHDTIGGRTTAWAPARQH